jgi:hypothetical protein
MRENRLYGSEGGGPQPNAALLPLSVVFRSAKEPPSSARKKSGSSLSVALDQSERDAVN